jgi:anthranilate phosphoribosyltransferase
LLKAQLEVVLCGHDLDVDSMRHAMNVIMGGQAEPAQVGGFLCALRAKGETSEEISAAAHCLRDLARKLSPAPQGPLLDTCGTGGDSLDTPNISTMVALVAAAAGIRVAKHGNRSVSSACGSADLLEALGIDLEPSDTRVLGALEKVGITFLYAPRFHPTMRHAGPIRRALRVRTLFNILGPLANPLAATHQVLGVFRPDLTKVLALTLKKLGVEKALVIHGEDGMDEMTTATLTRGHLLEAGEVRDFCFDPTTLGIPPPRAEELHSGGPAVNAAIAREVLSGHGSRAVRDLVALNAATAFWVTETTKNLKQGWEKAQEVLDSGGALDLLERWKAYLD